ncbi:immunity 49 family protein (plasmid) [Photobacterium sp. CCB-ST2H9]|uniref:immunity 49 family protein n=1 Tax=Photobacterium sp. CCB-ST2H9 TaxID=2912855 RepID=UPI0020044C67|nr:immunity 49 family protein [Photobacterium sp. CCB-ST2H9]UTM60440.1 immunity 49 family protein [Photobacterium sp. CCB-ST2H9]
MKQPTTGQIREWIDDAHYDIESQKRRLKEGFREKHNLTLEGFFRARGNYYLDIAIGHAMLGDRQQAKEALTESIQYLSLPYRMAYDETCEHRDQAAPAEKNGAIGIPQTNSLLLAMAALDNDKINEAMIPFVQLAERYEQDQEFMEMVQTIRALRVMLSRGEDNLSASILKTALDHSESHPIKGAGWRRRTYTINLTLWSVLQRQQETFDQALKLFLKDYETEARGENRDLPIAYASLEAVGLIKLARRYGLTYEDSHPLIPPALL